MLEQLIIISLATAFAVGVADGLGIQQWRWIRPAFALLVAALFSASFLFDLDGSLRAAFVSGSAFIGLALPSLLDSALTKVIPLPRTRRLP